MTAETNVEQVAAVNEQSKEQNAEFARRRREAERQEETKAVRVNAIIEAVGENPYTHEPLKDATDVDEYLLMKEIDKQGGDPLADYSKHLKAKSKPKDDWFAKDRQSFIQAHPDIKLEDLIEDKQFNAFAQGKVGTVPLSEIYEAFIDFTSEYEVVSKKKAQQMVANSKASPGSLASDMTGTYYSRETVAKMSQAEVHNNWDAIQESMKRWK